MPRLYPRRRRMTKTTAAEAVARVRAGESVYAVALHYGVVRSAIHYHLQGGKVTAALGRPWVASLRAARTAMELGQFAEAAQHFRRAADQIEERAK